MRVLRGWRRINRDRDRRRRAAALLRLTLFWTRWRRLALSVVLAAGLALFMEVLPAGERSSLIFSILRQRTLIILLLAFNLLILSLVWSAGEHLDSLIFLFINVRSWHPRWLDRAMWLFTQLGNGFTALLAGLLLYFVGNHRLAYELILGTLSLWLVVELVKALTARSRPYALLEEARVIGWREPGLSFPSGHTSQAFFLAALTIRYFDLAPWLAFAAYAVAMLVGVTRMYVGAHYPRDVAAGAMLGTLWGIMIMVIDAYFVARGG